MTDGSIPVLVTARFEPELIDPLRAVSPRLRIESAPFDKMSEEQWREAEVLYTYGSLPEPAQVPALRWVQLHSAGVEHVTDRPLFDTAVEFTTASGVHAIPIAEWVIAQVLALGRRVPWQLEWQRKGLWPPDKEKWSLFVSDELWGRTIGILGYGSIGRQVARLACAFGMRVLAMQRGSNHRDHGYVVPGSGDPEGALPERFYPPDRLLDLLAQSDVVVLGVPLTEQTRGMIDERALRAMKPNALLINVARGGVVDEQALVRALREHWIGGAALDVFEEEPLPAGHPLKSLPNVVLAPHASGLTGPARRNLYVGTLRNIDNFAAGQPTNVVNPEVLGR